MKTAERFWSKVRIGSVEDCWEWLAAKGPKGYGAFGMGKGVVKAHRAAWQLWHGELRREDCVLHLCDNPGCVNPAHLFLGTVPENNADMIAKGRMPRGESRGHAKLTAESVRAIRRLCIEQGARKRDVARFYGVSDGLVCDVVNRKRWKHVA